MTRGPGFICFKYFSTSALPRLYFTARFCKEYVVLLLLIFFSAASSHAEETMVFTDADLVNYKAEQMVDQESLSRMENDLKSYQKKKDAASQLERGKKKKQQAGDAPTHRKKKT